MDKRAGSSKPKAKNDDSTQMELVDHDTFIKNLTSVSKRVNHNPCYSTSFLLTHHSVNPNPQTRNCPIIPTPPEPRTPREHRHPTRRRPRSSRTTTKYRTHTNITLTTSSHRTYFPWSTISAVATTSEIQTVRIAVYIEASAFGCAGTHARLGPQGPKADQVWPVQETLVQAPLEQTPEGHIFPQAPQLLV